MGEGFKIQHQLPAIDNNVYFYKEGNEFNALTGGWDANNCTSAAYIANGIDRLAKNIDNLYGALTTFWTIKYRGTVNKIDLTNLATVKANIDYIASTNARIRLYIQSVNDANYLANSPIAYAESFASLTGDLEVDVTSLTGQYYVFVCIANFSASGSGGTLIVNKIWGEE